MYKIKKQSIIQFIKFGVVGCSNTVLFILIYWLLVYLSINYLIANIISYVLSSIWGYVLNKIWVFKVKNGKIVSSILKYYIVYGTSFIINLIGMYLMVDILKVNKFIAPILIMCITIPYNFIFNKLWAFRNKLG